MQIGGTEQVIRNLIEASDRSRLKHSLFCLEQPLGPWGLELQSMGVPVGCADRRAGFDIRLISSLRDFLKKQSVDVVHCHQYTPWVYGALAALGMPAQVIFT